MHSVGLVLVGLVAVLHVYFFVLEAFLWQQPTGLRVFNQTPERAATTAVLAKNQAFYNAFLAAGLFYSLVERTPEIAFKFQAFNLGCVVVAGVVGAATASKRILFIQALPALVALVLISL